MSIMTYITQFAPELLLTIIALGIMVIGLFLEASQKKVLG